MIRLPLLVRTLCAEHASDRAFAALAPGERRAYVLAHPGSRYASTAACWDGYEQVGIKTKDGKRVPNCVPKRDGGPAPQRKKRKRRAS